MYSSNQKGSTARLSVTSCPWAFQTDMLFLHSLLLFYLRCSIILDMLFSLSLKVVVTLHEQLRCLLCLDRVAGSTKVEHSCGQPPGKCQHRS